MESKEAHLDGELPIEELDIESRDDVITLKSPLAYDLGVSVDEIEELWKLSISIDEPTLQSHTTT